ncbi:MAG TPA: ABC transporter substrate-binding protein [Candidatus Binatia bacterium]|jgi:putative ABC transport system substrate-binding protein
MGDRRPNIFLSSSVLLALFLAAPVLVRAQTPARVGILVPEMERAQSQAIKGLTDGLKRLGYQERKNILFETRNGKGNRAALQPAVGELLARNVAVIFTTGTSATRAALASSQEVPVVFIHPADPVDAGLIKSTGERQKNLTGVAAYSTSMTQQRLGFLREIFPELKKILVFYDANNIFSKHNFSVAEDAAKKAGLQIDGYGIKSADELKTTLASLRAEPGSALFQVADDLFESEPQFIFATTREKKLPTMFNEEAWAIRGALAAYGPSYLEMGRQGAGLVDKIIKGEKPVSLPIERASKFDLTLNYRTANFIGFPFSQAILKKADKVIR